MISLDDRKHLFLKRHFTTDTRIQLESGGQDAIGCAYDLVELAWAEALQANQELNGDL